MQSVSGEPSVASEPVGRDNAPVGKKAAGELVLLAPAAVLIAWQAQRFLQALDRVGQTDFGLFFGSASAFAEGRRMYAPSFANMNPPHFHLLLLPLESMGARAALIVWTAAGLASALVSLAIIARETPPLTRPQQCFALVGLLAFSGTAAVIGMGQVSFLLMLPMTLAWRAERHGRSALAAFCIGLCTTIKPFLLIFSAYFVLRRAWRALGIMVSAAAAPAAVGLVVFGLDSYRDWLTALATTDARAWGDLNGSLLGLLSRSLTAGTYYQPLLIAPAIVRPAWLLLCAAVGGVVVHTLRRSRPDRSFAILILGAMLISPLGWIYYLWLALGPLVAWWWRVPRPAAHRLLWIAAPGLLWPPTSTLVGQPSSWATITVDSIYFWTIATVFVAVALLEPEEWAASDGTLIGLETRVSSRQDR